MASVVSQLYIFSILFSLMSLFKLKFAAGEVLEGVYVAPLNREESKKNVEKVLQFISSRHIRMPHISARGKSNIVFVFVFPLLL